MSEYTDRLFLLENREEIENTEKVLKMYADGYLWNPYTVRKDLWQTPGVPMIKVEGW